MPVLRPGLWVRSCGAVPEGVPPTGRGPKGGAAFLPGRGGASAGRWVLWEGFSAGPGWDTPGAAGAPGVFAAASEPSRRVARVLPGSAPDAGTAGPPGRGVRAGPGWACAAGFPGLPPPMVTLVWVEVWLELFTVLPPAEWVARVDWREAPVPAAPGRGLLGCFGAAAFGGVPAGPGRETLLLAVAPAGPGWEMPLLGVAPAGPDRGLPGG